MELVILFGPQAVGKMAVGLELAKRTGLKLFHNHMTIELVQPFFSYGTPTGRRLVGEFRRRLFEEIAHSDLKGLIFTYVWNFHDPSEKAYIDSICQLFRAQGARVSFAELRADLETRLQRNETELRLAHKPSKRDIAWSRGNVLESEKLHRLNTNGDFYYPEIHLSLDNSSLSPVAAAEKIAAHFGLA